jgi:hypothetical protein
LLFLLFIPTFPVLQADNSSRAEVVTAKLKTLFIIYASSKAKFLVI